MPCFSFKKINFSYRNSSIKTIRMNSSIPDCTLKCRSLKHALDVLSVVTKGSENQIKAFLSSHCYNAATIKDDFGRNALHLVSSCGKKGVLEWLIAKGVDPSVKDKESGWTALHRSIFYGHIDCVWSLLKVSVICLFKTIMFFLKEGENTSLFYPIRNYLVSR